MAISGSHGCHRTSVADLGPGCAREWIRAGAAEGADVASAGGQHLLDDSGPLGGKDEGNLWEDVRKRPGSREKYGQRGRSGNPV